MAEMFENKDGRTELSELGEFGLIEEIKKSVTLNQEGSILGIGDDAAIVRPTKDHDTVVSTDMYMEGVHFDLSYAPLKHLGYKTITATISDICAMNAMPKQVVTSIALSNRFSLEAVEEIYKGMLLACKLYKVDLVGGDTTSSTGGLAISVTAFGEVEKNKAVTRSGAQMNNLLVVSGDLGGAYMGLQILEREKAIYKENPEIQPDLEGNDYILERQLKPEARKDIVEQLADMEVTPTSMIDISDGLASEVLHLCKESNIGFNIFEDKIPHDHQTIDKAREFNLDPTMTAMNGGEDYELLFTVNFDDAEKFRNNPFFTVIGHTTGTGEQCQMVARDGSIHPITAQGWNHFTE
jgi:thiamine-monophosphate kinase